MLLYGLPAFAKGEPNSFLSGVARSHQLVKKARTTDIFSKMCTYYEIARGIGPDWCIADCIA
jgi:hypothetical protein